MSDNDQTPEFTAVGDRLLLHEKPAPHFLPLELRFTNEGRFAIMDRITPEQLADWADERELRIIEALLSTASDTVAAALHERRSR